MHHRAISGIDAASAGAGPAQGAHPISPRLLASGKRPAAKLCLCYGANAGWVFVAGNLRRVGALRRSAGFTTFDNSNTSAIKRNAISRLFADRDGNLWIDTLSGGVLRYKNGQFHPITADEGLAEGAVTAWCEDRNGVFWMATLSNAGLMQWRDNRFIQALPIEKMPQSPILTMTFDPQGALWLGTREAGLLRFKDGRVTDFRMKDGLPDDKVNSLYADRNGDLWIGTDQGISKWSHGKITREGNPGQFA